MNSQGDGTLLDRSQFVYRNHRPKQKTLPLGSASVVQ